MEKLRLKKMNVGVYIATFMVIASALMLAVMIGLAEFGLLQLRTVKLIVATETLSKVYDGEPLVGENYEIIHGRLTPGHSIKVLSKSSQTEIGECVNHLEFIIRDTSGSDVTDQYDIEQRSGTLKVALREIDIRLASVSKIYDGTPLSSAEYKITSPQGLPEGHSVYVYAAPEITDVGMVKNNGSVKILDENWIDVTSRYSLNVEEGTLEIKPRPITISTDSASKIYDGLALSDDGWHVSAGGLSEGHQLNVNCISELTEVGESKNDAIIAIYDELGADMTSQYQVTLDAGTLRVNAQNLYITTGSSKKVFDGVPLRDDTWQITSGNLNPGETIEMIGCSELNDVGTIQNLLKFVIRNAEGKDITDRYAITQIPGNLTVQPRKISIMTASAKKKYDGRPLYSNQYTLISGSLPSGHSLSVVGTRRTNIGISDNMPVSFAVYHTQNGVQNDVTDCYQITFSYGTLTVEP